MDECPVFERSLRCNDCSTCMFTCDFILTLFFCSYASATAVGIVWYAASVLLPLERRNKKLVSVAVKAATNAQGVSILICARNEAANLRRLLPSILEQISDPLFEVVVVDDASADDTPGVLAFFQRKYAHLRVLRIPEKTAPGKKYALAQGIAATKNDLLLLTDADCEPASLHWLSRMTGPLQENPQVEIVLGYAPLRSLAFPPPRSLLALWARFETAHTAWTYCVFAQMGQPYMGVGRNMAWRKSLFERAGGFTSHEHLPSGDDDLFVSAVATGANTAVCLDPQAFVFSEGKKTWRAWMRQKRRHLGAGVFYRPHHRLLLGALALAHSGHYSALLALTFTPWAAWAWTLWAIRMTIVWCRWARAVRVFKEPGLLVGVPVLDAMLGLYFGISGLVLAFSSKQTKW